MRPGQQRPGNHIDISVQEIAQYAFNEAGATTPRKLSTPSLRAKSISPFNEAGATTPRKQRAVRHMRPVLDAFNEAGATTPRKLFGDGAWGAAAKTSLQ